MIVSWDPGEKRTGCCIFKYDKNSKTADLVYKSILNAPQVYETLELVENLLSPGGTHTFVIENFRADVLGVRNNRSKASAAMFQWSEMETSQLIGTLKYAAYRMNRSPVVMQEPGILTMGRVWCDFKVPKGHIPDDISAYIHGAHYMMDARMIGSVDDITKFGQGKLD